MADLTNTIIDGDPYAEHEGDSGGAGHEYDLVQNSAKTETTLTEDGADKTTLPLVATFVGTQAEWNALSANDKAKYRLVNLIDVSQEDFTAETLWEGEQGDYTSTVQTLNLPLSKSYRNFRTLRFFAITSYAQNGVGDKAYVRDISTEQLDFIINTTKSDLSSDLRVCSCWGYGSNTDFFDIQKNSTPTNISIFSLATKIFKIEGSKF